MSQIFQESYHVLRYGAMENPPLWGKIIVKFSHLLLTLSSAMNILIYFYKVRFVKIGQNKLQCLSLNSNGKAEKS